jgi:hypothetical protein
VEDLENKINSLLSSPESMERIMQLARALSGNENSVSPASSQADATTSGGNGDSLAGLDPRVMQMLTGAIKELSTPSDTERLIAAIKPYLSHERIDKVDKALSICRLARIARKVFPEFGGSGHV